MLVALMALVNIFQLLLMLLLVLVQVISPLKHGFILTLLLPALTTEYFQIGVVGVTAINFIFVQQIID